MGDRTQFVPSHVGENVLPNLPFFHKLLRYAQRKPSRTAVRDVNAGVEKTYHDVLSDALAVRSELERTLSHETLQGLAEDQEVYIGLLAPGGYEYAVGFIAIVALGAAVVPMGEFLIQPRPRTRLIPSSCRASRRRSLILSSQSKMRRFSSQQHQRVPRAVYRALDGRE